MNGSIRNGNRFRTFKTVHGAFPSNNLDLWDFSAPVHIFNAVLAWGTAKGALAYHIGLLAQERSRYMIFAKTFTEDPQKTR
jgi:hypothetical protein